MEDEVLWKGKPSSFIILKKLSYLGISISIVFYILRIILNMAARGLQLPSEVSYLEDYIHVFDVILMVIVVMGLILFIYSLIDAIMKKKSNYVITNREILIGNKIISPQLGRDAKIEKTFFDNIFGTGDIVIGQYKMETISHPEEVYEILQKISEGSIQ